MSRIGSTRERRSNLEGGGKDELRLGGRKWIVANSGVVISMAREGGSERASFRIRAVATMRIPSCPLPQISAKSSLQMMNIAQVASSRALSLSCCPPQLTDNSVALTRCPRWLCVLPWFVISLRAWRRLIPASGTYCKPCCDGLNGQ